MTFGKQWLIETNQKLDNLERENIAMRKQLGENTQLVRALEERQNEVSGHLAQILEGRAIAGKFVSEQSEAILANLKAEGALDFLDAMELPKRPSRATKASKRR